MKYAIGIDLGGTSIKYGVVSEAGDLHYIGEVPTLANEGPEAVLGQIYIAASQSVDYAKEKGWALDGIGLGTPGIVDESCRVVLGGADNIIGWENIDIASFLEEKTGLRTRIGNDANMMGLGETLYGAGKGCTDVVFITVGTGIGGAVVIGGKLLTGYAGRGTELGHIPLIANGEPCNCGATGCLEQYASTSALVRQFKALSQSRGEVIDGEYNGRTITRLYKAGDKTATECMNKHYEYLGKGIAGFINIFSPQRVIIGGGITESGGKTYKNGVSEMAFKNAMPACAVNTSIELASLGNKAGLIGAASLILTQ